MPSVWPALTADDIVSGREAQETVGEQLFDRDRVCEQLWTTVYFPLANTSSTSYVTAFSLDLRLNAAALSGRNIIIAAWVQRTAGTGNAQFRIQDQATATLGTVVTATGTRILTQSVMAIPDNTWAQTERIILGEISVQTGGASMNIDAIDLLMNLHLED